MVFIVKSNVLFFEEIYCVSSNHALSFILVLSKRIYRLQGL